MLLGQIGTWITAWFAYNYHWQMVYYAMLGYGYLHCLYIALRVS